ncbi:MAG: TPM domain-containing protein [Leptospiraceae bacterium]|nr:TPM domain-containing protein [Leptospiraceae bacterium]MCK6380965.1 TPM domain-containing protein [Leptospiraceae bacterium]NUM40940.1 TPM domain-containing protein [Leptospiraceae bacterium]
MNKIFTIFLIFFLYTQSVFGEVSDTAGMFHNEAVSSANQKISEIQSKFGKNLVIETFPEIKNFHPSEFALQRAREKKVNGVYILIAKKEKKIEIKVGSKTREIFGSFESGTLKEKLASEFKAGKFDSGLNSAIDYYSQVLSGSAPLTKDTRPVRGETYNSMKNNSGSKFSGILTILFFVLIAFIIIRLIKNFTSRNRPQSQGEQNGMFAGGRGIMGGILGGIFGAIAGNWIYDKLTGRDNLYGNDRYSDNSSYYGNNDLSSDSWSESDDGSDYSSGDSGSFDGGDSGGGDW